MTKYQQLVERWKNCRLCQLAKRRINVVMHRGNIPCDVLFVGEAPGDSEDIIGLPFVGPAGKLLDIIIADSQIESEVKIGICNLLGCIPKTRENNKVEPIPSQIIACSVRLRELVNLANPKIFVCVGKLSDKWLGKMLMKSDISTMSMIHPAAILRQDGYKYSLMVKECVSKLRGIPKMLGIEVQSKS